MWFKRLRAEMGNMRLSSSGAPNRTGRKCPALVTALFWFWWLTGYSREGRDLAQKALALPSAMNFKVWRAAALSMAGFGEFMQGNIGPPEQMLEEAVPILRASSDEAHLAWSLQFLGLVLAHEKEYALADQTNQEGLAIARRLTNAYTTSVFFLGDVDLLRAISPELKRLMRKRRAAAPVTDKSAAAYPLRRLGYMALSRTICQTRAVISRKAWS